jgi:hypothetical protein
LDPDLIPSSKVKWSKKIEYSFVIELQITALKEVLSFSLDRSRDNPGSSSNPDRVNVFPETIWA